MFFYKVIHWMIYFVFKNQAAEVKGLDNLPNDRGFIIAANHDTAYDPLIIIVALRKFLQRYFDPRKRKIYFLGNVGIKYKIFRYSIATVLVVLFGEKIGYLPANRAGVIRAVELLKQDHIVGVFPEGRLNVSKQLLKGHRGVSVMAMFSGKEIIPTGCFGPSVFSIRELIKYWNKKKRVIFNPGFYLFHLENQNSAINTIMQAISKVSSKDYPFTS